MSSKAPKKIIFVLLIILVVTALASFITKLVPQKNENTNLPNISEPSVVVPVKVPVSNVDVSKQYFIFVG